MDSNRCGVCKALNVSCAPDCICAPHFPSMGKKFDDVHLFFGAENVRNILCKLNLLQRAIAAKALCYAAECRRRDSIVGPIGMRRACESTLNNVEENIKKTKNALQANGIGPDEQPTFFDFLNAPEIVGSLVTFLTNLTEAEQNQFMQWLERSDSQDIDGGRGVDGALTSGTGHGADGASSGNGAGPSS